MKLLGIDEAGRGPVFGSMFIGGVLVDVDDTDDLGALGLKDSKELTDGQRDSFVPQITELAVDTHVVEVTASEIDELRQIMSLNMIELNAFARIIENLQPDSVVIDLPEPDGDRFVKKIKQELPDGLQDMQVTAEHKADENFPIVSGASILAKSAREAHTAELKETYGADFNTGYPHDQDTIDFLKQHLAEHGELPDETRTSWSTAKRIKAEQEQRGIGEF